MMCFAGDCTLIKSLRQDKGYGAKHSSQNLPTSCGHTLD